MDLNHLYDINQENLQRDVAQVKNIRELIKRSPDIIRQRTQGDSLDLSGLQLTSLQGLDFIVGIDNITELNLSNNALTIILNDIFRIIPRLQVLKLNGNQISRIEPLAFNNLKQLQQLYLDHNKLTNISVEFAQLFFLTKLDLCHNQIEKIAPLAFRDLWRLQILDLSHNNLLGLPDDLFVPLQDNEIYKSYYPGMNLNFLDLSNNSIAHLSLSFFTKLKKLEHLNIRNNTFKPSAGYKKAILKNLAQGALIDV